MLDVRGQGGHTVNLPEGYKLERDPDVWTLYGPGGEIVARFVAGAPDEEIERAAEAHARGEEFREVAAAVAVGLIYGVLLGWGAGLSDPLW